VATSSVVRQAVRAFIWLGVIFAILVGGNALAVVNQGGSWVPKLALDLQGGTQIILEPRLAEGQTVSEEQLNQAVAIIRQRVDASGVAEAEVTTQVVRTSLLLFQENQTRPLLSAFDPRQSSSSARC